ncbi:MAG: AmmeMemoRadiSam system protein A [Deltaproteobacteria bacterium]|nr:MAG: AmmeMemoRadiSam system protein A [Deltaproteobacteria bacterium]
MAALTDEDRKSLLILARSVIESELVENTKIERPLSLSPSLKENRGCFVTLHKNGVLRGCIGTIEPVKSLVSNVEENAINAAFKDPRFPPLEKDELSAVDIEISVLTVPSILDFEDGEDLKKKLRPGIDGVILSRGWHGATFLPQVWEQLSDKESFLGHLCQKAGMERTCWKDINTQVKIYQAEYFSESSIF